MVKEEKEEYAWKIPLPRLQIVRAILGYFQQQQTQKLWLYWLTAFYFKSWYTSHVEWINEGLLEGRMFFWQIFNKLWSAWLVHRVLNHIPKSKLSFISSECSHNVVAFFHLHVQIVSRLLGRDKLYDSHQYLTAWDLKRWDTNRKYSGEGWEKKGRGWPHTAVWSTRHSLMEGLITGGAHSPYHTCLLSAPHWIIPEGRICTPSIIYCYHKDPSLL